MTARLESLDWRGLSRRRFLKAGLAVAGSVALPAWLGGCGGNAVGPDGRPLLFLSATQARTLAALADAVLPQGHGFPNAEETGVVRRVDEELSFVGASIRGDMGAAIGVLEYAPLLYGHLSRFSKLDIESRRAVVRALMTSRTEVLRAVGANMKILPSFFYFGHPATWKAMGYDGPFAHLPPIASEQRRWYAEQTRSAS